jgi:hypothetical protein
LTNFLQESATRCCLSDQGFPMVVVLAGRRRHGKCFSVSVTRMSNG